MSEHLANSGTHGAGDSLDRGLAEAFGDASRPRTSHPSVLKALQARTNSKLGVHLESQGLEDAPVKVTEEVKALRDPTGRYQVLGEIGRGGMGIVYKGRDQDLGRDVAMKVLKDEYATRADVLARFVEEAQIGGQLQHPGIVPVYELGLQSGERPYFAMKLVKGETLAAQLAKRSDPMQERRRLLGIFEQVCQTVAYAHARRVVHRDLKPANVMIGAFGEVQVVDWGFAKVLQRNPADEIDAVKVGQHSVIETARSRADSGSHSVAGSMMGTLAYMPPEQALGDIARVDERSDVFALGAILCELLTGDAPYREQDGDLVRQAANAQLDGAHARLAKCGADEALIALSRECLSPAQRARPASAAEVAERISSYLTSVEERARQAEVRAAEARLKHRVTLMSAGAGVLVLALAAGAWIWIDAQARARRAEATQRVASAMSAASGARGRAQSAGLDASLWSTAVSSAEQLVSLANSDDVGAKSRSDADELLATVQSESEAAEAESARLERDTSMLAELAAARIPLDDDVRSNAVREWHRLDSAYAQAFAAYLDGASLLAQPAETTLASLRHGSIGLELAASLDHWGLVRDALRGHADAPDPAGTARIREIAQQLDAADPWRTQLRALLPNAANEGARLRELAEHADFDALTAVGCRVLSQALWSAGENDAAVTVLRRGQELHSQDFDLCFQLALRLELVGDRWEEALATYRIAHAIRPEQTEVLHRAVFALDNLGRPADAERLARLALDRRPLDADLMHHLGSALLAQFRFDEAIAWLRKAIAVDDRFASQYADLGMALVESGRPDEALGVLQRAVEVDPKLARSHYYMGVACERLGRNVDAERIYRHVIELDPNMAMAHNNLGSLLLNQQRADEAKVCYRRALELDPRSAPAHLNLGLILATELEELDRGLELLRTAEELFAQDPSPFGRQWLEISRSFIATAEKDVAQRPAWLEVLAGRKAASSEEWNRAVQLGHAQKRYREVVALTESTLRDAPELIGGDYGASFPASAAVMLAASTEAEVTQEERVRLRGLACAWLGREVERWIAWSEQGGPQAAAGFGLLAVQQVDRSLASVRGGAIDALPEEERAAWRALWKRIEERAAK